MSCPLCSASIEAVKTMEAEVKCLRHLLVTQRQTIERLQEDLMALSERVVGAEAGKEPAGE